ncbi:MAG TPA: quinolinate synthase NadA [Elusimicrobiota bacterium]|nr:quinolinate synthase NadA [Elusimicrobiota bacterium]
MTTAAPTSLVDDILRLKKDRDAVILAHNYQIGEIQDIADFVGDSLALSRQAAKTSAKVIVFCGVHFMAETAAILCPDKTVLLPDLEAGCSLASTVTAEQLRVWKRSFRNPVVVSYVNTSAAVKAESDICCTSSNAVQVVRSIPPDKDVLFVPDMYLGEFVRIKTGRTVHLWPGSCHVHFRIRGKDIEDMKQAHPGAEFVVHPECGCLSTALKLANKVTSTGGMMTYVRNSPSNEFIVATETGILHSLQKENPGKTFYPVVRTALCEFMKMITLEKVLWSLEDMKHRITVPPETSARAKQALDQMLSVPET